MDALSTFLLSPGALGTAFTLVIVYAVTYYLRSADALKNVPLLVPTGDTDRDVISKGYKLGSIFKIPALHNTLVILPTKYLDEIKSLPEHKVSFDREVEDRFIGHYTGVQTHPDLIQAVKVDLTRNIAQTIKVLQEELEFACDQTLGDCKDWTSANLYQSLLRIVAMLSGRVFVGLPLSRDEKWIDATITYTLHALVATKALVKYPSFLRPLIAPFLPELKEIAKMRKTAANLIKPSLEARLEEMKQPGYEKKKDLIEWMMGTSEERANNVDHQAKMQLLTSLAAIHTTTTTSSHVINDLLGHPEYIKPLREEIQAVLDEDNGIFIKTSMTKLRKLDSFIKESQRLSPVDLLSIQRKVMSDIQLSDGTVLKKNTSFAFASYEINTDDSVWANAKEFDGFRFEKLRQEPGSENKYQFVTTASNALNFGHGSHACPGRFFASNEIKLVLCHWILNYDMKFEDEKMTRPENICHSTQIAPNPTIKVMFRKREV